MKTGDDCIVMYAVIPKDQYGKVLLPDGSFAKAFQIGKVEQLVQMQECKHWGMLMSVSLQRLAKKLCPEVADSPIIRLGDAQQ